VQDVELIVIPSYWVADDLTDAGRSHDPDAAGESSWLDSLVMYVLSIHPGRVASPDVMTMADNRTQNASV